MKDLLGDALAKKNEYGTPSKTLKGETVKSHAEQKIADYLTRNGVRYEYEHGAQTNALIFKTTFARPDFYLPDYNVYIEYWGLVGVDKDYRRIMKWKMAQYHENNIKFISIYPDNMNNLDWVFRAKFRKVLGREFPSVSPRDGKANFCSKCGKQVGSDAKFCRNCGRSLV
ncbi:MAG TPA: zinc-ribbon domain-containing protein [Nitrososphaerales archaeon]|nr:zinc-ribbon domain-containing protein [Nitrososphaerales archaeon]